ncbi:MAG: CoB--CoM heterodisulfide reductase iron-sulfur subunit A family protein [Bacteroidales bacterium]|nr:CoB--CoM heterodisulfide reductase iron-sulfur subunit A family protein [Bacteroidales bacterium]
MRKTLCTGVYFSHSDSNHSHPFDYQELYDAVEIVPEVTKIWNFSENPVHDQKFFIEEIKKFNIDRIIIAGFRPGYLKPFFAKALQKAGKAPENILLTDIFHGIPEGVPYNKWVKAKLLCTLYEVPFEASLLGEPNPVNPETLIIGGGIAGIQASLEIANSHNKVYLIEKTGTIGGHMAMFDKTFPTLDCAACILTPKMVDVSQHPYIELLTYSEIADVSGAPGNYKVKILKKARRVDITTCTGCGICTEKCPTSVKSEFDSGASLRKAIYIPFPQAVPNKYLIDADSCRYVQTGKCGICVKFCPVENCINLDEQDQEIEITVGNIVVATGFKPFDAGRMEQYGYGKYPNVITSLELERLVNASGPTGGNIVFRSQDKKGNWIFNADSPVPKSIALIHCIGSRDENYNKYCSRVCCMYSLKLAHLIGEKLPETKVYEYYIDMRAFGKGYEEFYNRIKEEGIHLIRGKTAKIKEQDDRLILRTEDIEHRKILEQSVDMVVLSVGLEPGSDAEKLASILGIQRSDNGWFKESDALSNTNNTLSGGILLAGTCQGPKDIPDSVVQGSAAALSVIQSIQQDSVSQSLRNIPLETIKQKAMELSPLNGE